MEFEVSIENDELNIVPSGELNDKFIEDLAEELFWHDAELIQSHMDGWWYVVHMNTDNVFPMDDYGYNLLENLKKGEAIMVAGRSNHDDYEEYEWNEVDPEDDDVEEV
jgi:hypothetical protein